MLFVLISIHYTTALDIFCDIQLHCICVLYIFIHMSIVYCILGSSICFLFIQMSSLLFFGTFNLLFYFMYSFFVQVSCVVGINLEFLLNIKTCQRIMAYFCVNVFIINIICNRSLKYIYITFGDCQGWVLPSALQRITRRDNIRF